MGAIAVAGLLVVGGCGEANQVPAPRDVAGPVRQAALTVERLERAVRVRDFATICRDLLTPEARRRAGGRRCAAAMEEEAGSVERPRLRVVSVAVMGRRATATVRTSAAGQGAVDEKLALERIDGRYRIVSLGG